MSKKNTHKVLFWTGLFFVVLVVIFSILIPMFSSLLVIWPRYTNTFPLDDEDGRYIINYDGDYWLTLYEVQVNCTDTTCTETLIKKGNTSITEAPVDLKPYIDKPIRVTGSFVNKTGAIFNGQKTFCIKESFIKSTCHTTNGPGVWYNSPLKIHSIELAR